MSISCLKLGVKIFKIILRIFVIVDSLTVANVSGLKLNSDLIHLSDLEIIRIQVDSIKFASALDFFTIVLNTVNNSLVVKEGPIYSRTSP